MPFFKLKIKHCRKKNHKIKEITQSVQGKNKDFKFEA